MGEVSTAQALAASGERAQFSWIDADDMPHVSARINSSEIFTDGKRRVWVRFHLNDHSTLTLLADQEVEIIS